MAWNTPGVEVEGPQCRPTRFGLLSVAEVDDVDDVHWMQGFHHEQLSCEEIETRILNCPPPATPKSTDDAGLSYPEGDAFFLIAPFHCSTGSDTPLKEAWGHAEERLGRTEDRSVERVFWTGRDALGNVVRGTLGGDPDAVDVTPAGGAVDLTDGLSLLEFWAAQNMACAPIIHAARGLAPYFAERHLIGAEGAVQTTVGSGSLVALGSGYGTSGPDNVAAGPGEAWIWVTGSVKVQRAPVFFTPERGDDAAALDRKVNDVTVFAERVYGALRECGTAAVRVTLGSCCGSSAAAPQVFNFAAPSEAPEPDADSEAVVEPEAPAAASAPDSEAVVEPEAAAASAPEAPQVEPEAPQVEPEAPQVEPEPEAPQAP